MIDDTIKKDINETEENPVKTLAEKPKDEIVDVDLGFVEKKRFRINGDYNRMLELNVSDLNIFSRLEKGYEQLKELGKKAQETIADIPDEGDADNLSKISSALTEIDGEMRKIIDYIFDTNASEVCVPSGNMFDPVGGQFRFERIIDTLTSLYSNGLRSEFTQLKNNVDKKTSKYTKKKK